jgi:uncharacterized protein (TIGR02145 family)
MLLKNTNGWSNGNGTDQYGFSALPGGIGFSDGFRGVSEDGKWWSADEYDSDHAYNWNMYYYRDYAGWTDNLKSFWFSVRCLQD